MALMASFSTAIKSYARASMVEVFSTQSFLPGAGNGDGMAANATCHRPARSRVMR